MPKLPKNMIRRKGKPGFWFRRKINGRVVVRSLGSDYEEACRKLRVLKREEWTLPTLKVGEAAERWLNLYVATARSPKGQRLARQRIGSYLVPCLGHYLLAKLTGDHLRGYRLQLEKSKLSVQSVRHILADARCFLYWCEDAGLLDRSPFPRKILPRVQERPPDRLTEEEVNALRAMPEPYGFVARLGLGTGLRWGELCRVQSTDIQGEVMIVHQTKTGKVRRVPLPPALLREVRSRVGKLVPYADTACGAFAHTAKQLSGVRRFHAHQMRHTFACRWLEAGGSLAALQQILGHSTIVTTQRYARLSDEAVMAEARRLAGQG